MSRSRQVPNIQLDPVVKKLEGFDTKIFSKAPAEVMLATIKFLHVKYGSISAYLVTHGFSIDEQEQLSCALTNN
jgi:hypothetical protein